MILRLQKIFKIWPVFFEARHSLTYPPTSCGWFFGSSLLSVRQLPLVSALFFLSGLSCVFFFGFPCPLQALLVSLVFLWLSVVSSGSWLLGLLFDSVTHIMNFQEFYEKRKAIVLCHFPLLKEEAVVKTKTVCW